MLVELSRKVLQVMFSFAYTFDFPFGKITKLSHFTLKFGQHKQHPFDIKYGAHTHSLTRLHRQTDKAHSHSNTFAKFIHTALYIRIVPVRVRVHTHSKPFTDISYNTIYAHIYFIVSASL